MEQHFLILPFISYHALEKSVAILDEALKLHDVHIKDPKTATEESQAYLMHLIEHARDLVFMSTQAGEE